DVFLELNGLCVLERRLELREAFFLFPSGMDLSALSAAIPSLISSGASVNFLVRGSMPDMIIMIFIDTSSYWARPAKPFFLATAAACASSFGSGLSGFAP